MSAKVVLDVKGLVLAPGELSRASGSLTQAVNVNVEAPGIIRSRNGFAKQTHGVGGPGWKFCSTKILDTYLLFNYGTDTAATGLKYGDGSASWTTVTGTVTNQPETRMQCAVGRRNHYITSDEGPRRLVSSLGASGMDFAGMPKGLAIDQTSAAAVVVTSLNYITQTAAFAVGNTITGATSGATAVIRADFDQGTYGTLALSGVTGTFNASELLTVGGANKATTNGSQLTGQVVEDGESVSYRQTWCLKDAEGIVMESAPSSATIIYNNTRTLGYSSPAGDRDVLVRMPLPKKALTVSTALTTSYFFRLYRTASFGPGIEVDDEMQLVGEQYLTATNITDGYADFLDRAPEAFRALGDPLYTNAVLGGDVGPAGSDGVPITGIQMANENPPRARDVALFADCMFYSDLVYPYTYDLTLLSTVDGIGLSVGDTLTIASIVYTAIAPGTPTNNQFVVATVAAGSTASEAIERTAQNLVEAINRSTTNTSVWAYYLRDPEKLPGKMRFEMRNHGAGFSIAASAHGRAYRPSLESQVASTLDYSTNGYCYSKPNKPDAVPSIQRAEVGPAGSSILRMVVLGESIFFFTDAGIYRLTGRNASNFSVIEFDLSFRLIGREMVAVCDDAIYAWGVEGIAKITTAGVEIISNAIEPLVQAVINASGLTTPSTQTWLASYAWAAAYRSRHKVLFAVPTSTTNKNCATVYVYDTRMQAWTTWEFMAGSDGSVTTGHTGGAVRWSDDLLFLGQWNSYSSDSKIYKERLTYAATDFRDDAYDKTNQVITKTVKWNVLAASPELETHWDELHLLYDVSQIVAAWTTPTAVTATFTADMASAGTGSIAPTATSRMSRCSVPQAQRRSARMEVKVTHATPEYFGLEGMVLVHLPGEGTSTVDS